MNSSKQIKTFLLDNLSNHQKDIIQAAINRFGISRQAIHKHMNRLIADRKVIKIEAVKKMWGLGTPEDLNFFVQKNNK